MKATLTSPIFQTAVFLFSGYLVVLAALSMIM